MTCSTELLFYIVVSFLAMKTTTAQALPSTYYGKAVGPLTQFSHGVSGMVYVVDDRRILIRQLTYDGDAPAAYFWIGLKGKSNAEPDTSGFATPDENGSTERIKRKYTKENVLLTLKAGIKTSDILWLSLWCKQFQVNFGHVMFPRDLIPPHPMILGQFSGGKDNLVKSGPISVQDHKTILIEKFTFTGQEKNVFFVAGKGSGPSSAEGDFTKIPLKEEGLNPFHAAQQVKVTLMFPDNLSVFDVDYVSLYSTETATSYGQVSVPKELNIPPNTDSI